MGSDYITVTLFQDQSSGGSADKYGDRTETPTGVPIEFCRLAPGETTESSDQRRATVLTTGTLYMPPGSPVPGPRDYVETPDGRKWLVVGDSGIWGTAGIEVRLRRWEQPS